MKVELSTGGMKEHVESSMNLKTQSELFRQYAEANHLYLNNSSPTLFWFEFGGNKIGRLSLEPTTEEATKWK